jgi:Inner membrane protein YgaP-like, transmembrane domain
MATSAAKGTETMYPTGWRRAPRLIAGLALMLLASFCLGETPLGWATAALGVAVFISGSAGLCLACALTGCRVKVSRRPGG